MIKTDFGKERYTRKALTDEYPNRYVCLTDIENMATIECSGVVLSITDTLEEKDEETKRIRAEHGNNFFWISTKHLDEMRCFCEDMKLND